MKAPPERLGSFYLGSIFNLESGKITGEQVNYDARDLTTHAFCVGMTGSGKTGLSICLLEEAAIDKVPSIIIDPKGDITNHLLHFPELQPENFIDWVNIDDARRRGKNKEEFSREIAETWKNGLNEWGISKERIKLLSESVDFTIYTPGSSSGVPINILSSLDAPENQDSEAMNDLIIGTVTALLELSGLNLDPIRSKEGILLATIIEYHWKNKENLSIENLIREIQTPPFNQLGIFELETFYPKNKRLDLAMNLNALIASPSFSEWLSGDPIKIDDLLYSKEGNPRHSIFSLSHLNDEEKMFFVTLLLERISSWIQHQPGTTSLRAILFFDEIFGFMPPVANPPSKKPLLRLLKQARAYGLGLLLVTQNPVDIDYKGLANIGTWFIGKLQTERDKNRLLQGLTSAINIFDEGIIDFEKTIGQLNNRVFLLHNVHEKKPVIFHTRWAMNYLRGPLTRTQIKKLMAHKHKKLTHSIIISEKQQKTLNKPPSITPNINQYFLSAINETQIDRRLRNELGNIKIQERKLLFKPNILARHTIRFYDKKKEIDKLSNHLRISPEPNQQGIINWGLMKEIDPNDIFQEAPNLNASYVSSNNLFSFRELSKIRKQYSDYLYYNSKLKIHFHPELDLYQKQDETKKEFLIRIGMKSRERRDREIEELEKKFEKKLDSIESKIDKLSMDLSTDIAEYEGRKREEIIGIGETVLGLFLGKRRTTGATTAARRRRMTIKSKKEIEETEKELSNLKKDYEEIEKELKSQVQIIISKWQNVEESLSETTINPRRNDINIHEFSIVWTPHYQFTYSIDGIKNQKMLRAFNKLTAKNMEN
jgi:hypothetical protein